MKECVFGCHICSLGANVDPMLYKFPPNDCTITSFFSDHNAFHLRIGTQSTFYCGTFIICKAKCKTVG